MEFSMPPLQSLLAMGRRTPFWHALAYMGESQMKLRPITLLYLKEKMVN
jgi:hypothetical protein